VKSPIKLSLESSEFEHYTEENSDIKFNTENTDYESPKFNAKSWKFIN
jgi:hypothetical protein